MRTVDPLAFQFAGSSAWELRWALIDTDTEEILMFTKQDCIEICGTLSGDSPSLRLVFDRNGFVRSYFKVFDPDSNTCIGTARCLKAAAQKIVQILASSAS
jgi:hypothetical protein